MNELSGFQIDQVSGGTDTKQLSAALAITATVLSIGAIVATGGIAAGLALGAAAFGGLSGAASLY